jgi:hypothetical protein
MRNRSKPAAVLALLSHARPMRPATCANEARLYRNPTNPDWSWTALSGSSRHAQTSADDAVFLDPVHSDRSRPPIPTDRDHLFRSVDGPRGLLAGPYLCLDPEARFGGRLRRWAPRFLARSTSPAIGRALAKHSGGICFAARRRPRAQKHQFCAGK